MKRFYADIDCLLFPSKLETWGMPISEAKAAGLPIIAADMPYAREAVGNWPAARFVDANDPAALAAQLMAATRGETVFEPVTCDMPTDPFARDWASLLELLAAGL